MAEPFFKELLNIQTKNELYNRWIEYLVSMPEDQIREIIDSGLTYQADAIHSMVRELIAGQPVHRSLSRKLKNLKRLTETKANILR